MRMPEQVYGCAAKAEDGCAVFANVNDRPVAVQVQALGAVRMRACKVIRAGAVWADHVFVDQLPTHSVVCLWFDTP